jgi:Uma2 family endonuclease
MVSMTRPDLWHDPGRLLTVDDLACLPPGDDRRYELDDGMLIASPAPLNIHQLVVTRLTLILAAACPDHLAVLAGVGINITRFQHRVPDVAVVSANSFDVDHVEHPPALVVEVSSQSTRLYDRNRKKDVYEGFGIPAYWIIEPEPSRPRLVALELRDGHYQTAADVVGSDEFRATLPFGVAFRPAVLIRTGPLTG